MAVIPLFTRWRKALGSVDTLSFCEIIESVRRTQQVGGTPGGISCVHASAHLEAHLRGARKGDVRSLAGKGGQGCFIIIIILLSRTQASPHTHRSCGLQDPRPALSQAKGLPQAWCQSSWMQWPLLYLELCRARAYGALQLCLAMFHATLGQGIALVYAYLMQHSRHFEHL
ncbi:hypothetical protein GOP47_0030156 [Adiantum capillus-veneris]|nr:hypothetical protein GOP47_0030156 [Adiantum capillus-veneris]